jgi:DNA polymerase I-like protein with 3'-5' exonuclease and polymerase domains
MTRKLYLWTNSKDPLLVKRTFGGPFNGLDVLIRSVDSGFPETEPGDVVLCCGGKALSQLQEAGVVRKGRSITSQRELSHELPTGAVALVTFDPALLDIDPGAGDKLIWDARLAARLYTTGSTQPPLGDYRYVQDLSDAVAYLQKEIEEQGSAAVCVDTETQGLVPYLPGKKIVCLQITYRPKSADVLYVYPEDRPPEQVIDQLRWIVTCPNIKTVGANLKYDRQWLREKWRVDVENQSFDTTLVGSLLDENRSNSLNTHAKVYTDMGGYDDELNQKYDKGKMEGIPKEDLLPYAGGDTDACFRVYRSMKSELINDPALTRFYVNLLHPASQVFVDVESRGICVSEARYMHARAEVSADMEQSESEVIQLFGPRLRARHRDKGLSLTRAALVADFLFTPYGLNLKPQMMTPKGNAPSTAVEHIEMLLASHPGNERLRIFAEHLSAYNKAKKTLGTFIDGFVNHLRPDGKFHPSFILHHGQMHDESREGGTVTGRLAAKDPPTQIIPKHTKHAKLLRWCFVPPPGYVILLADYSQGELRVTACRANEQNMISAYRQGIDMHLKTGAAVYGMPLEHALAMKKAGDPKVKSIRQGGKAGNFGLIYGMQPPGFCDYARTTYGVGLSLDESKEFRDTFFGLYPGLLPWHDNEVKFATAKGYVRSPLGRVRHLPLINSRDWSVKSKQQRQAINSPIQSCLSDLLLLATVELKRRYPDLWIFNVTHDEAAMYIPENEIHIWAPRVQEVMETLPLKEKLGWDPPLDFPAELEIGEDNLGETVGC